MDRRRHISRLIAAAVLVAGGWLAGGAQQAPAGPGQPLTVMSFNIRYGTANDGENHWTRRREMLFDVVREQNADLVGVQEALAGQIDEIVAAVPVYAVVGVGRDDGRARGEFSAILFRRDRFRVADSGTFWFSDTPAVPGSKSWGNSITRIATWARFIDRDGAGFYHFNLHLDHQSQPSREREHGIAAAADRGARRADRAGRHHWRLQRRREQPRAAGPAWRAGRHRRAVHRHLSRQTSRGQRSRHVQRLQVRRDDGGQDRLRVGPARNGSDRRGDRANQSRKPVSVRPLSGDRADPSEGAVSARRTRSLRRTRSNDRPH